MRTSVSEEVWVMRGMCNGNLVSSFCATYMSGIELSDHSKTSTFMTFISETSPVNYYRICL